MELLLLLLLLLIVPLVVLVVFVILCAIGVIPVLDGLNTLFRKIGLSGASPEGRTPGQVHVGRVTRGFVWDREASAAIGHVFVNGELWEAECQPTLVAEFAEGTAVRIVYQNSLRVRVLGKAV